MQPRGRGRTQHGRATGGRSQQPPEPGQMPGSGGDAASQQAAWGARAQAPTSTQGWPRAPIGVSQQPSASASKQTGFGRGSSSGEPSSAMGFEMTTATASSKEDQAGNGKRGSVRGRIVARNEIIITKPQGASKMGCSGRPVNLLTNYLSFTAGNKWILQQYRVDFSPEVDQTSTKKGLFRTAVSGIIKGGYLFDGTVCFTPMTLNPSEIELNVKNSNDEDIRICIRLVGSVHYYDYHYIQIFNLIIRKCLSLMKLQLMDRHYYNPSEETVIREHKLQVWPGFFTAMRQHERDVLLNVDLQFKVMRTDNVYDLLMECCNNGGDFRREFQKQVIGTVIITYYNRKTYRIHDVAFDQKPTDSFQKQDGTRITFVDYFKQKHNQTIRDENQPLLISRSSAREIRSGMAENVVLIPELCRVTGLSEAQRNNFQLMRSMAEVTRVNAEVRVKRLSKFAQDLSTNAECVQEIKRWDLNFGKNLLQIKGRELKPECIYSSANRHQLENSVDWTTFIRAQPMFQTAGTDFIIMFPTRATNSVGGFLTLLVESAKGMGWKLQMPERRYQFAVNDNNASGYTEQIVSIVQNIRPKMIVIVLANQKKHNYLPIKKKCCVDLGVPTQMVLESSLRSKNARTIATKIAIQMNCKMGGAPWKVHLPPLKIMIVGYDVCRDTANRSKCFAGMVATINDELTRYYSEVAEHTDNNEISKNFGSFMVRACGKYQNLNGCYPDKIVIYRDGVGDGDIPHVYQVELVSIKNQLRENIYTEKQKIGLTFIIVSKRITTKLFLERGGNPRPGTVVDDVITLPERFDFYLISQCVRQGTVSPTSFNVLENTCGLDADKLQVLSYKLTHMYYNWSGTIRVPAPCQYAHKLAFLTSQYLHCPANKCLNTVLYYL